jgi:hypothetical protein
MADTKDEEGEKEDCSVTEIDDEMKKLFEKIRANLDRIATKVDLSDVAADLNNAATKEGTSDLKTEIEKLAILVEHRGRWKKA